MPFGTVEFKYDVLGNRVARLRHAPSTGTGFSDDTEYYVNENGKLLLEFDGDGKLQKHNLWAANVDRLLAVEDVHFDSSGNFTDTKVIVTVHGSHAATWG